MVGVNNVEGELGDFVLYTRNTANLQNLLFGLLIGNNKAFVLYDRGKATEYYGIATVTYVFIRKPYQLDEHEKIIYDKLLRTYRDRHM